MAHKKKGPPPKNVATKPPKPLQVHASAGGGKWREVGNLIKDNRQKKKGEKEKKIFGTNPL